MTIAYILIAIASIIIPLLVYAFRKGRLHDNISNEYLKVEEEQDLMIETMMKIYNDKSFKIWFISKDKKDQWIEMNIKLITGEQKDYKNLDNPTLTKLLKFTKFLIDENNQFPLFLINNNTAIIPSFNEDDLIIGTSFVTNVKLWKKEIKNDFF